MAITLVASSNLSDEDSAGGNPSISWPTLQTGDVTYVFCSGAIVAGPSMSTGGYTALGGAALSFNGGNSRMRWFRKVQGGSPDTVATMTGSGSASFGTCIAGFALRGVDNTTPEDASPTTATGNSTNPDPASITTATDGAWVLAGAASANNDSAITVPSSYSNLTNANSSSANPNTTGAATREITTAGAENPGTFGSWITGQWGCITVAVRPAPAVGGSTLLVAMP